MRSLDKPTQMRVILFRGQDSTGKNHEWHRVDRRVLIELFDLGSWPVGMCKLEMTTVILSKTESIMLYFNYENKTFYPD